MITLRFAHERELMKLDWLESYHNFYTADYYAPKYKDFNKLKLISEDFIAKKSGFPLHDHNNLEIITYIINGSIEHTDSLGNKSIIQAGEVQLMRAGSGISHSEYNPSTKEDTNLLQIWIVPQARNLAPGYQQQYYSTSDKLNKLCPIANPDGTNKAMQIEQDVDLYTSILEDNFTLNYTVANGHKLWIQVASGSIQVNQVKLTKGDSAAITKESMLQIQGCPKGEFLLFDFYT